MIVCEKHFVKLTILALTSYTDEGCCVTNEASYFRVRKRWETHRNTRKITSEVFGEESMVLNGNAPRLKVSQHVFLELTDQVWLCGVWDEYKYHELSDGSFILRIEKH